MQSAKRVVTATEGRRSRLLNMPRVLVLRVVTLLDLNTAIPLCCKEMRQLYAHFLRHKETCNVNLADESFVQNYFRACSNLKYVHLASPSMGGMAGVTLGPCPVPRVPMDWSSQIVALELCGCQFVSTVDIDAVAERCYRTLTRFVCSSLLDVSPSSITRLCAACTRLRHFEVRCVSIEPATLRALARPCLEVLMFTLDNNWPDTIDERIAPNAAPLQRIEEARRIMQDEMNTALVHVVETCPNVKQLTVTRPPMSRIFDNATTWTVAPEVLCLAAERWTHLRELNLFWAKNVTNEALGAVLTRCTRLQKLVLMHSDHLDDALVTLIRDLMHTNRLQLEHLDLLYNTNVTIQTLSRLTNQTTSSSKRLHVVGAHNTTGHDCT